ncbi:MAG: hypothetical protein Q7R58_01745 [bacterium]|nr:hypothetical protein [bacterium]
MKSNTIILVAAALVIAAGVFWYYSTKTGNEPPLTSLPTENQAQTRFQMLVSELRPITFNTGIFSESRFMALVDLATPISPEAIGRLDPFSASLGVNGQ